MNRFRCLLGAIAGDVIGSVYEYNAPKHTDFPLFTETSQFTDDTVLTIAIADALIHGRSYLECVREYALAYPGRGYGTMFLHWVHSPDPAPYHSYGNGAAMRVSPIAWAYNSPDEVLDQARACTVITHDHSEGIRGAQAVALAVFRARSGASRKDIQDETIQRFGYDLSPTLEEIRPGYRFDESCQGTVPPAIIAFLVSDDYEDAIRKAISLGGDADTLAAITGSIAEAFYGEIPQAMVTEVERRLPDLMIGILEDFNREYGK